jgi:hypothetical protein
LGLTADRQVDRAVDLTAAKVSGVQIPALLPAAAASMFHSLSGWKVGVVPLKVMGTHWF